MPPPPYLGKFMSHEHMCGPTQVAYVSYKTSTDKFAGCFARVLTSAIKQVRTSSCDVSAPIFLRTLTSAIETSMVQVRVICVTAIKKKVWGRPQIG